MSRDTSAPTYEHRFDGKRLGDQLRGVLAFMEEHPGWHTLREIEDATSYPQASISARLRDMRNKLDLVVERQRRGAAERGLWEYRLRQEAQDGQMEMAV